MAVKFLDYTGLGYFWSKIKAWCNATFAAITHNQASNTINAMTSYSKPSSGSAITTSDSLNDAIGKLEAKVDAVDDSNYVHLNNNEAITGVKTFKGLVDTTNYIVLRHNQVVRGTNPSNHKYSNISFLDASSSSWEETGAHGRLWMLEGDLSPTGQTTISMYAYKNIANNNDTAALFVGFDSSGNAFARTNVPTPTANPDSRDLVTRGYLDGSNSGVVHLSGVETITGRKSFTGGISGVNKDNSTDNANSLYNTEMGTKSTYFTTGNSTTKITNLPDARNTILESRDIRYYSDSDKYIEQLCHNADGIYYRMGSGTGWSSWKKFAFVEDVVTKADAQTITGTKTFNGCDIELHRGSPYYYCDNVNIPASGTPSSYTLGGVTLRNSDKSKTIAGLRLAANVSSTQARLSVTSPGTSTVNRSVVIEEYSNGTYFYPDTNNAITLGSGSYKWSAVYATTSTINTSDARLKNSIISMPDVFLDMWENVAFCQFKFNDSVAEKGEDARIHTGVIAQDIQKVFNAAGIDADRYGFFCWDSWEGHEVYDDDGNPIPENYVPAGDQYSIRYEELLCIEAAYQRRKNKILENRISELERQVSDMLQILQSLKGAS